MRFFKEYRFQVGRKMEFKDLFGAVDTFLAEHNLSYASMGYDLAAIDFPRKSNSCQKIVDKMPQFGPVERIVNRYSDTLRLSNMTALGHPCDEASIRLVGSKISRPYNFFDAHFYFRNVTFFGICPAEERVGYMTNPLYLEVSGSYIELFRSFEGPQTTVVFMKIEVMDQQSCDGADAYAGALAAYLKNAKYTSSAAVYMDPAEKECYDRIHEEVAPIVKAAKADLYERSERMREQMTQEYPTFEQKSFSITKPLKRLGKEHGFQDYYCLSGNLHLLSKRVDGGNVMRIEMARDRREGMDASLILSGPDFSYEYSVFYGAPENQEEANWHISHLFEIVDYFEARYMHDILAPYPKAPDWYSECV